MKLNPDTEVVKRVREGLQKNKEKYGYAYCPCQVKRTEDTICPCKPMREDNVCHCGLFVDDGE